MPADRYSYEVERLNREIESAIIDVVKWQEAATRLSQSAADARAKNQGVGRGFGGALFGAKYRAIARSAAAASNAEIARDVAAKRAAIANGKRAAQDRVRELQAQLKETKREQADYAQESRVRLVSGEKKKLSASKNLRCSEN